MCPSQRSTENYFKHNTTSVWELSNVQLLDWIETRTQKSEPTLKQRTQSWASRYSRHTKRVILLFKGCISIHWHNFFSFQDSYSEINKCWFEHFIVWNFLLKPFSAKWRFYLCSNPYRNILKMRTSLVFTEFLTSSTEISKYY